MPESYVFALVSLRAAKRFDEASKRNVTPSSKSPTGGPDLDFRISKFLDWPKERVSQALAQLSAIEDGELSKKAVKNLTCGSTARGQRPVCGRSDLAAVRDVSTNRGVPDTPPTPEYRRGSLYCWRGDLRRAIDTANQFVGIHRGN